MIQAMTLEALYLHTAKAENFLLDQKLISAFYKHPAGKCFSLCGPDFLCCNPSLSSAVVVKK